MAKDKMKPVYTLGIYYEDGSLYIDSNIKTEVQLSALIKPSDKARIVRVKVTENDKRSLDANALYHVWIKQIASYVGEDVLTTEQTLKIKFGYKMLMVEGGKYQPRLKYLFKMCNWLGLTWPQKVKMAEIIPCTSLMTTKEMKQYMENIKEWAMNQFNIQLDNGVRE